MRRCVVLHARITLTKHIRQALQSTLKYQILSGNFFLTNSCLFLFNSVSPNDLTYFNFSYRIETRIISINLLRFGRLIAVLSRHNFKCKGKYRLQTLISRITAVTLHFCLAKRLNSLLDPFKSQGCRTRIDHDKQNYHMSKKIPLQDANCLNSNEY